MVMAGDGFMEEVGVISYPHTSMLNQYQNPDIVQEFFRFCETVNITYTFIIVQLLNIGKVAHYFLTIIYHLPQDLLSSLLLHAIAALSLQERYSLVGSCKLLVYSSIFRQSDILNESHS
jgi:hypothetical protein